MEFIQNNWGWILLGFVIITIVLMYNSLIARKNMVENMFGSIDALLKQRYDMIPNLVASVREYMKHEREVLEEITKLRSAAINAKSDDEKIDIENRFENLLSKLMVNIENYPQLKANENFLKLQEALKDIEDRISAARRAYNQAVTDYNNAVEMFPANLIAKAFNFKRKKVFEIPESERENVNVGDLFRK
ncbi:LemA family protein [Caminibacter mediatlanticus]|uniref:LemA protein n=1 Tax=Caminibacter mediatlanticus TB-2 TaxID=391592 RepID=A0AAI9F1U5_9BACT|nr:LemA family protein [Caminibacter mediatlanticus]EDM23118.1 putative lemA protein [Caminibacter mediatlanticus TB-2]